MNDQDEFIEWVLDRDEDSQLVGWLKSIWYFNL